MHMQGVSGNRFILIKGGYCSLAVMLVLGVALGSVENDDRFWGRFGRC